MSKSKALNIFLLLSLLMFLVFPNVALGGTKEKIMIWDSTAGHAHDGSTKGKKVAASDVTYDNSGSTLTAAEVKSGLDELDSEKTNTSDKQNTISDDDSKYPSSGAVVDYTAGEISTHSGVAGAHHTQTTSFATLIDSAADAQIPNNITIDYAAAAGDADTVDSQHFTDIQSDTSSQISTHASDTGAHHAKSHAHNGGDGSGTVAHSDTTGKTADDHHDDTSDTYNITPATVTTTGDIKINSDSTSDQILFGTSGDVNLYRGDDNTLKTDDNLRISGGILVIGEDCSITRVSANVMSTPDAFIAASVASSEVASTFTHATTTKAVMVGAEDAISDITDPVVISTGQVSPSVADGTYYTAWVPVQLPIGATVTRIDNYGLTNDADDAVRSTLTRSYYNTNAGTSMATCSYADGTDLCADSSVTDAVAADYYTYYLLVELKADDSISHALWYSTRIEYTTTDMSMTR